MSSLLERMLKNTSVKGSSVLSKSKIFDKKEFITTDLPILNIAFSGSLDGGLVPGLTVFAAPSKHFKSLISLYCMKAFLDKYPESIAILYDSEYGITPDYLTDYGIDPDRVIHIPIENIENLTFDIVKKLEEVDAKKDKVFIMIDSIGNLASKKEATDAENENSVVDMSRAKSIKSLFRIITPHLTKKNIPCVVINHVYANIGDKYNPYSMSGGSGIVYSANQIFTITKATHKDPEGIAGFRFTLVSEKSRFVREKSKFPFNVMFEGGIQKWSTLFDLALEFGAIVKPNMGWYQIVDTDTGEVLGPKKRAKDIESSDEFFEGLIKNEKFKKFVESRYKLAGYEKIEKIAEPIFNENEEEFENGEEE